ncbi:MAG: WD40 repeat domain-containing protein [Treponema sp.]|nr:WD40 repeat domain-containing protein [Treponema sp.]
MKKKRNLLIPLCITFSIVYIILAARPLKKELQFSPQWTIDATKVTVTKDSQNLKEKFSDAIPFKLGQTLGYFTTDGDILNIVTYPYKAALSRHAYTLYGTSDKKIPFYTPDGTKAGEIVQTGFPFFTEEGQYLFLPGGSAFAKLSEEGNIEWTYENYAPITAFASSHSGCVAGYSDGTIISFTGKGSIDQTFKPSGSEFPVILGTALSPSGNIIACISGQKGQRFIIAKKAGNHTEIIHHEYLEKETTRQKLVKFSADESTVYYDSADGLGIVDCKKGKSKKIKISGHILSIQESEESRTVFVLSRDKTKYTVLVVEPFSTTAGAFSFEAQTAFIAVKGDCLFVGRDNEIAKMKIQYN